MGLSIHYKGVLKHPKFIQSLTIEVADICKVLNWKYGITDDVSLAGISITPDNCETLALTFKPDGRLALRAFMLLGVSDDAYLFTKTQFAGIDTHIAIIRLLRYLSNKYFSAFELIDEGEFWETNDVGLLRMHFKQYEAALYKVESALANFEGIQDETAVDFAKRLDEYLHKRLAADSNS